VTLLLNDFVKARCLKRRRRDRTIAWGVAERNPRNPQKKAVKRWKRVGIVSLHATSIPNIALVEIYFITVQELTEFVLKSDLQMVIRLVPDLAN